MESKEIELKKIEAKAKHDAMRLYGMMVGFFAFVIVMAIWFMFFHSKAFGTTAEPADLDKNAEPSSQGAIPYTPPENDDSPAGQSSSGNADTTSAPESAPAPQMTYGKDPSIAVAEGHNVEVRNGITYIDGILIVNKSYSLPSTYDPGPDNEAMEAFTRMANDSWGDGISLFICSGYRSYAEQEAVYNRYAGERGTDEADRVSSRPGHSEHQTGLAMDINTTEFSFEGTSEAVWLEEHCADYGFIIRFPKGKELQTGYEYEPWHIRYVGIENAKKIKASGLCLEEYLGISSHYDQQ